jgi:hypothetical protein
MFAVDCQVGDTCLLYTVRWEIHVCCILSGGRYMFAVYCQVEDDSVVYTNMYLPPDSLQQTCISHMTVYSKHVSPT